MQIPFNKTHLFGDEQLHVNEVMASGNISGNGIFTKKCHQFFKENYAVKHCLLTNSCTAALEMAALLIDIQPGDEVIMPAYGYVSTANAFVLHGAKIIFVDSMQDSPNMDVSLIEELISEKTKAIVVMHYGGIAVDMDVVMQFANKNGIYVIEDAAHGIDGFYKEKALGTIGHLGTLSFHSTKNITSGHGGLLMVNDKAMIERSNVIWQKGTDKTKFDLGHQAYYEWIDVGSSFFPSELTAAFLFGQLKHLKEVTKKRLALWDYYAAKLERDSKFELPKVPSFARHNGHIFYVKVKEAWERKDVIKALKERNISAYSHYLSLPESPFLLSKKVLTNASMWRDRLLRMPLYYDLQENEIDYILKMENQ